MFRFFLLFFFCSVYQYIIHRLYNISISWICFLRSVCHNSKTRCCSSSRSKGNVTQSYSTWQHFTFFFWNLPVPDISNCSYTWTESYFYRGGFSLDAIGVGILQLPFSIAIVILGPIAGIIAAKYGATKLLISSALTIPLSFILLTFLHSTHEQVGINLIFFGIGSGMFITLDAIIILFIPKDIRGTSAAVMNTLRIIGGAIWPIISGVIMQIFLVPVIVNGEEQLFPSVVAFNLIFFICMILGIVLTIEVIFMK